MSVKLSYSTLVGMNYYDMMSFLASDYNVSETVADRISTIATTSNVQHMLDNLRHRDEERADCIRLIEYMENVVENCVRKRLVGLFENVSVICDHLHEKPFDCFFPNTVGLSRNVVTQIIFKTKKDLNQFKIQHPELYTSLVKRCER